MRKAVLLCLLALISCRAKKELARVQSNDSGEFILIEDTYYRRVGVNPNEKMVRNFKVPPGRSVNFLMSNIHVQMDCRGITWNCGQHMAKTRCVFGLGILNESGTNLTNSYTSELDIEVSPGAGTYRPENCDIFKNINNLAFTWKNESKDTVSIAVNLKVPLAELSYRHNCDQSGVKDGGKNDGLTLRHGFNLTYRLD